MDIGPWLLVEWAYKGVVYKISAVLILMTGGIGYLAPPF